MTQGSSIRWKPRRKLGRDDCQGIGRWLQENYDRIGGSASNDGGMGLLRALGVDLQEAARSFTDAAERLEKVESIDISGLDKRLKETEISVICDVTNPLLGPNGATYIYGKQKGAVGEIADRLEKGMENYAQRFSGLGVDIVTMRGAGAAGGVGAALGCVLGASLKRGHRRCAGHCQV